MGLTPTSLIFPLCHTEGAESERDLEVHFIELSGHFKETEG